MIDRRRNAASGRTRRLFAAAALVLLAACGESERPAGEAAPAAAAPAAPPAIADRREAPGGDALRVVFLGDSLTAGLGLGEAEAFPALVGERLERAGHAVAVVNAGVSGDTSAGGLARLGWILRQEPDVLVVELGANDGLRGISPEATEENLRGIVRGAQEAGARVLLLGIRLPPNYGPDYRARFEAIYPRVAAEFGVPLVPFFLEGVGGRADLNLGDGIHPNAAGQRRVADNVYPAIEELAGEELVGEGAGGED